MTLNLTKLVNYKEALSKTQLTITAVNRASLQQRGDYEFVVLSWGPNHKQKPHFHTYGDIDIFTVASGSGYLHIAKVEEDRIVQGSEETLTLKEGDTYCIDPYILHSIETKNDSITVLNIAPGGHSTPADGEKYQRGVDLFFPLDV